MKNSGRPECLRRWVKRNAVLFFPARIMPNKQKDRESRNFFYEGHFRGQEDLPHIHRFHSSRRAGRSCLGGAALCSGRFVQAGRAYRWRRACLSWPASSPRQGIALAPPSHSRSGGARRSAGGLWWGAVTDRRRRFRRRGPRIPQAFGDSGGPRSSPALGQPRAKPRRPDLRLPCPSAKARVARKRFAPARATIPTRPQGRALQSQHSAPPACPARLSGAAAGKRRVYSHPPAPRREREKFVSAAVAGTVPPNTTPHTRRPGPTPPTRSHACAAAGNTDTAPAPPIRVRRRIERHHQIRRQEDGNFVMPLIPPAPEPSRNYAKPALSLGRKERPRQPVWYGQTE